MESHVKSTMKNSGREKYLKGARKYQQVLKQWPPHSRTKKKGRQWERESSSSLQSNIEQETIAHATK
jgi:hypothetical protein